MKILNSCLIAMLSFGWCVQEKRRAERAEQQRIRAEKDKERQARREVRSSICDFILFNSSEAFQRGSLISSTFTITHL